MSKPLFAWISARIPVEPDWYTTLHDRVLPFFRSADVIFLCDTWFYELSYRGTVSLDLYIYADSSAIHGVLLPALRERFSEGKFTNNIGHELLKGRGLLEIERWDAAGHISNQLLGHFHESTQLYCSRRVHRKPGAQSCFDELSAATRALRTGSCDLVDLFKRGYQEWISVHLSHRYAVAQADERLAQEEELTAFLISRPQLEPRALISPSADTWLAATQAVCDDHEGDLLLAFNKHIGRYGLDDYEAGAIWASLYSWAKARVGRQQSQDRLTASATAL